MCRIRFCLGGRFSALSSPTAIGIFSLLLDARVRGTGDVVNSVKKIRRWVGRGEGGGGGGGGGGVGRDTMTFVLFVLYAE